MAKKKKPKAPALRSGSSELGAISSAARTAYDERRPALQTGLQTGVRDTSNAATASRMRELRQLQQFADANVTPTANAVRAEYDAIRDRFDAPTQLETANTGYALGMLSAGNRAISDPASGNRVLQSLESEALAGDSPILREMQRQALGDLSLGRTLSPEEQMQAQQAARAGFAARGMGVGTPSATAEVLNRDAFATQREANRRGFGATVEGLGNQSKNFRLGVGGLYQGAIDSGRQFALGAGQLSQGANAQTLQREGMRADAATQAANFNFQSSPAMIALGQQSMVPMSMQAALQTNQQSDVYPQTMGYLQDVNNTNFNARESRYLSDMNRFYGGRYGAAGAGGGGNNAAIGAGVGTAAGAVIGAVAGLATGGALSAPGAAVGASVGGSLGTAAATAM